MSPSPGKQSDLYTTSDNQGLATLLVMIVVLAIIILFCCFAAPGIRDMCRKYCRCQIDNPDRDAVSTTGNSTPTIILLPYGRMLVVDRNIFAQLQADHTGIDFMELSANMIRAQHLQNGSTPSILDSDTTSKGYSPTSLGLSPPAYEDIFGEKDLPPSYSELSFMLRCFSSPPGTGKPEGDEEDDRNSNALRNFIIEELNSVAVDRLSNSNSNQCNVDADRCSVQENEQPAELRDDVNNARISANSMQSDDDVRIGDDMCTAVKESSL